MRIELRKINVSRMSDLLNNIENNIDFYMNSENNEIKIYDATFTLEEISEPLDANGKNEIDLSEEELIFQVLKWKENYLIGKLLHKKLRNFEDKYYGTFYERGFWAYICHLPIFRKYIKNRYFSFTNKETDDEEDNGKEKETIKSKIERFYLCQNAPSRTGIMFNWMLTDCLYDENKLYDLAEVGFSYIDSVKAIYERSFHKNKNIVKAFVIGIINNNRSSAFKDAKNNYRSKIPTHISNIAALNLLDSYDNFNELVTKITMEQKHIIAIYEREKNKV